VKWLEPEVHPGWAWARIGWAVSALMTWIPRSTHVAETYSTDGILVSIGPVRLTESVMFSPAAAWSLYAVILIGVVLVGLGRAPWLTRLGLLIAPPAMLALGFHEGLNFKAYDRLLCWEAMALFVAPGAASGRHEGSPAGRYMMTMIFMCLYASTGWMKIVKEPRWWSGVPLATDLVHRQFGMKPLGIWMSEQMWLLKPMSWVTLIFEGGWPLLILIRQVRPWLLLIGASFHIGVLALMDANTFTFVALAAYPVLLPPAQFTWLRDRAAGLLKRQ